MKRYDLAEELLLRRDSVKILEEILERVVVIQQGLGLAHLTPDDRTVRQWQAYDRQNEHPRGGRQDR